MKAGTHNHLKVKRLKRLLGLPLYRAVGVLESLWLLAIDCCDEGDIGKFTDEEIADYLEWDGNASELVRALSESGWIDPDTDRRLVIHDWLEHCPEYIRDRVRKRHARHAKKEIGESNPNKQKSCDQSTADISGQSRTPTVVDVSCPVYTQPNPTQPIPTHSNQGAASAASDAAPKSKSPRPLIPDDAPPADEPPASPKEPRAEDILVPTALNTPEFLAALRDWFHQRRRRRLSLRADYVRRQFARLLPLGPANAAACLRHTVDQDYDGLFPEKFTHGNRSGNQKIRPGSSPVAAGERGL